MNVTELLPDLQKIDAYIAEFKDSSEKEIQAGIIRAQKAMGDLEWALKSLTVARRQQRDLQASDASSSSLTSSRQAGEEASSPAQEASATSQSLSSQENEYYLDQTQAARWLGIISEEVLRLVVYGEGLRYKFKGDRMWIPISELERIEYSTAVRDIQESDRSHNKVAALVGEDRPLTQEEMDMISAARPGQLPWKR
jgi:hypothetical protein